MTKSAKIHRFGKMLAGFAVIVAAVAVCAPSPGASSEHFVIVNDNDYYGTSQGDNFGTILKLEGTKLNPLLQQVASLATGEPVLDEEATPNVQVIAHGADICIFLVNPVPAADGPETISAFRYPGLSLVGNYANLDVPNSAGGTAIVASGSYLLAGYNGYDNGHQVNNYMASWGIGAGCALTTLHTYEIVHSVFSMAATPNGETLVVSYFQNASCCVDSFSIKSGGVLTEHGPYYLDADLPWGLDITKDSNYAIFNAQSGACNPNCYTQMNVFSIEADGSLGTETVFGGDGSLGLGNTGGWIRLSPDERFLFATDDNEHLTTLNFTESPLNITYTGCFTTLRLPKGESALIGQGMATALPSGAGGGVYVAEENTLGLLAVNSTTGCTVEAPASPFFLPDTHSNSNSLVAWPPRGY